MVPAGALLLLGRLLGITFLTAALSEVAARTGAGLLPFLRYRPASALERYGLGLLLGFSILGLTYLGLALAGLFSPLALAGGALALACGSTVMWQRRLLLVEAAAECRVLSVWGMAALALGLAPLSLFLVIPEWTHDAWVYHLGVPWQYLQAGRAVLEISNFYYHFPLNFEMAFALPLIAGDDRLAKGMVISCFVAASAVLASRCLQERRVVSAWLGPLLALVSSNMLLLVVMCKSDVPAAALFVAGALLQMAGAWAPGSLLMGFCVASKLVYGPVVAVWCLYFPPPRRRVGWWVLFLVLPSLLWWTKTWLATGNPVYPFASKMFPSLEWSAANRQALWLFMNSLVPDGIPPLADLPAVWINSLRQNHLLVLLVLPGLLLFSSSRRAVWACVTAQFLVLGMAHLERFLLPATWLLYLLIAREAARLPPRWQRAATGVLAAYALTSIGIVLNSSHPPWERLSMPLPQMFKNQLSTFLDVKPLLAPAGTPAVSWRPGAPRSPRVLSIGEWRLYQFPCRLLYGGIFGETPVVWKMARESWDPAELRKKFRQLGAPRLMHNYVSGDWVAADYHQCFPWDQPNLRLYVEFCKRYLTIAARTERCDYLNGGFYVYEIRRQPLRPPPKTVWFAPGIESVYGLAIQLETQGLLQQALPQYLAAFKRVPDVGQAWNRVGHAYAKLNDVRSAFRYLRKFGEDGMLDSVNLGELGAVAVRVGELDLAERVLAAAMEHYPDRRHLVLINQALCQGRKAFREVGRKDHGTAATYVARGFQALAGVPESPGADYERSRRNALAFLSGVKGEMFLLRGESSQAAAWFLRAAQLAPQIPLTARWRKLAEELGTGLFPEP